MARRNDFLEGFLKGLYSSGVGNPEVQRQNEANVRAQNADLAEKMAGQGMVPNQPSNDMTSKIGSFISSMFGGSSTPQLTASSFKTDPNFTQFYIDKGGNVGFQKGKGSQVPEGTTAIPTTSAITQMGQQRKYGEGNMSFDSARSYAKLMNKPSAFDDAIKEAQDKGQDYLTKDVADRVTNSIKVGSWEERGKFYNNYADIMKQRLELQKRIATYGGKMGQGQQAINTAIGHLGDAMDSMTKLGNTDVNALNTPINEIGKKLNNGDIVAAGINLTALENELAAAYKGGGATDQEIAQWRTYFNTSLTPQQWLDAAIKTSDLLNSKIGSFGYQQGLINPDVAGKSPVSPAAQKVLDRISKLKEKSGPGQATHRWNPATGRVEPIQ